MTTTPLPAPKNELVDFINAVLTQLIEGYGKASAIAAGVALVPWLGWPVINQFFSWLVDGFASYTNEDLRKYVDNLVIAAQNHGQQLAYEQVRGEMIKVLADHGGTDDQKKAAADALRKAIDALVQRTQFVRPARISRLQWEHAQARAAAVIDVRARRADDSL